jgi:hypothetical protein
MHTTYKILLGGLCDMPYFLKQHLKIFDEYLIHPLLNACPFLHLKYGCAELYNKSNLLVAAYNLPKFFEAQLVKVCNTNSDSKVRGKLIP